MGLTFKKRDDFDKMMDDLGVSTVDLVTDEDEKTVPSLEKKGDPFAKFLAPKETSTEKKDHN
ncbi:SPJ_0845 family protein [Lactococcus sp.]|uniref:SPJ_0845 family protein n=1 Tax=Lactococcus sp. TaxID=44273 RepID=UPI002FC8B85F